MRKRWSWDSLVSSWRSPGAYVPALAEVEWLATEGRPRARNAPSGLIASHLPLGQLPEGRAVEVDGGPIFIPDDSTKPGGLIHHLVQTGGAEVLLDARSALLVHHFLQPRAGKDIAAAFTCEGFGHDAPSSDRPRGIRGPTGRQFPWHPATRGLKTPGPPAFDVPQHNRSLDHRCNQVRDVPWVPGPTFVKLEGTSHAVNSWTCHRPQGLGAGFDAPGPVGGDPDPSPNPGSGAGRPCEGPCLAAHWFRRASGLMLTRFASQTPVIGWVGLWFDSPRHRDEPTREVSAGVDPMVTRVEVEAMAKVGVEPGTLDRVGPIKEAADTGEAMLSPVRRLRKRGQIHRGVVEATDGLWPPNLPLVIGSSPPRSPSSMMIPRTSDASCYFRADKVPIPQSPLLYAGHCSRALRMLPCSIAERIRTARIRSPGA